MGMGWYIHCRAKWEVGTVGRGRSDENGGITGDTAEPGGVAGSKK